ncbi:hypothetical protein Nepgr_016934 [Nepenthes gracilis]|uniref:Protein TIFY n=1 Tax=Nepenthes gracilis TaxID=150966 RepID=A0AAD3SNH9_NEPGR|nr:hypothetical protein Nepgr_016934 [Nepenthes gracilis]
MSGAQLELDFFRMEKQSSVRPHLDRRRSFRGIQNAISKISPGVLKSVIASGSSTYASISESPENARLPPSMNSVSMGEQTFLPPPSPASNRLLRPLHEKSPETTPMTIFYGGKVCVYDLPRDQAERILKFATGRSFKNGVAEDQDTAASPPTEERDLLGALNGDLPIFRRKSLEGFLEKRRERLISVSPYYYDHAMASRPA